ncbi:type II toxin-antitoxin system VapC family toxin [Mycoplana rhizolycopersici]|jgi:predicted nucleic acid-binding protein|uniref:Type II toxin-antitoxin system VapC family toxin n=1 Tax=Mycoplana rhizolycopersici TaxID=2746702 RepID=A0ABX2QAL1_9HYPH|nr:type II toxin-antitoxin system VapC family toxin [Rhizobium rhizolycopersici]NVP54675.1 type II toxin-antitoxin system VapC family toxin [Rhizobium rhizolycopersici]
MIVLDTNVISESVKEQPDANLALWMQQISEADLFLCDIVMMELSFGAERFRQRTGSERYLRMLTDLQTLFSDRIVNLSLDSAILSGKVRARREGTGRPISVSDAMIAAICLHNGAALATRNVKDFEGLDLRLVNPFEGAR